MADADTQRQDNAVLHSGSCNENTNACQKKLQKWILSKPVRY